MAFTPKVWQNGVTLSGSDLIDLETRVSNYSDLVGGLGLVVPVAAASGDATGAADTALLTSAVATAKAAGGGIVQAKSGQVYQVRSSGSTAIRNPSGSISTRNRVVALPSGVTLDLNGSMMKLVGSECSMVVNEGLAGIGGVLSAPLSPGGGAITTLPVTALLTAIPSGSVLTASTVGANGQRQSFTTTALASVSATSIAIASVTPTFAFPSGTGLVVRDANVGIINAVFNDNNISFSTHATLQLAYIDGLKLHNVKLVNGIRAQGWVYDVFRGDFDEIDSDGMQGQAWTFGDPQPTGLNHNGVYESQFGRLRGQNVTLYDTSSQPGNPFNLVLYSCTIESIYCRNCSGGVKLQQPSTDVSIGVCVLDGIGELSALQGGFKLQGDATYPADTDRVQRVSVGEVIVRNGVNTGLYLYHTQDCSIGSYTGFNNVGMHSAFSDVVLAGGINDYVGHIRTDNSGGGGVQLTTDTAGSGPTGYRLPYIKVTNPGQLQTTLTSGLSTGAPITTLPVAAMPTTITTGKSVVVTDGVNTQTFTTSGTTVQGATSLTIASATPTFAFLSGTQVLLALIRPGVRIDTTSSGSFGEIDLVDNQTVHTMTRGVDVLGSSSVATIEKLTASGFIDVKFNSASAGVGTRDIANTSGATLAALETTVNAMKAAMRASGAWI